MRLTLGRQEIGFDNERILGAVDWSQRARALDAARLTATLGPVVADLVYAKLLEDPPPFELDATFPAREDDADFVAAHVNYGGLGDALQLNASYYLLDSGENDITRHTVGTYLVGKLAGFNYDGEFYYEFGDIGPRDASESIHAWMVAGTLGYTFPLPLSPNVTGRFEALSGDGTPGGAFDPFFGTNHKFYGEADFFLVIPAQTGFLGLMDPGFVVSAKLAKNLITSINAHFFLAMEENAAEERYFGTEIDLKAHWQVNSFFRITGVYGPFFPGEAMRFRSGAPDDPSVDLDVEHFGYLTVELKI
ncbi:MAG: alginate export family protein [Myxococcales bacterium]|nr:alginate export family protein [Myxococcales bacterium]